MSAGMEPAGSPVTVRDGDFSSPDAPRGTGRPKSLEVKRKFYVPEQKVMPTISELIQPTSPRPASKSSMSAIRKMPNEYASPSAITWIMNEPRTTIQPQPPSGGVGRVSLLLATVPSGDDFTSLGLCTSSRRSEPNFVMFWSLLLLCRVSVGVCTRACGRRLHVCCYGDRHFEASSLYRPGGGVKIGWKKE